MIFLMMVLAGFCWAMFIALQLFRPDQIAFLPMMTQVYVDGGFSILLLLATGFVSWSDIKINQLTFGQSCQTMLRNIVILSLGIGMFLFISHELLNGLDPSGRHSVWKAVKDLFGGF